MSAVSAEIVGGMLPEKRFSLRYLCHNGLLRTLESAGRLHGGGGGAYRSTSLVSEEMPAGNGPVSMFAFKVLAGTPRMQRRSMHCVRVCKYSKMHAFVSTCRCALA